MYISYSPEPLDNISLRPEIYWDAQGNVHWHFGRHIMSSSLGWQHWFSPPQLEMRPEIGYYHSNGGEGVQRGHQGLHLAARFRPDLALLRPGNRQPTGAKSFTHQCLTFWTLRASC